MVRDAVSIRIANCLDLVAYESYCVFTESSIRTLSGACWITMHPVGCRDLHVC